MNSRVVMISGGARSGKSTYALKLGGLMGEKRAYIATAQELDDEMRARIRAHKSERNQSWDTFEEPVDIFDTVLTIHHHYDVMVLDCLTLWVSNLMGTYGEKIQEIEKKIKQLKEIPPDLHAHLIVVTNEVGMGIVPDNPLARKYRDLLGTANQSLAKRAYEVIIMFSGLALRLK